MITIVKVLVLYKLVKGEADGGFLFLQVYCCFSSRSLRITKVLSQGSKQASRQSVKLS